MNINRIDHYYHIRDVENKLENDGADKCGLCYQTNCTHNVERIDYRDAQQELATWAEVALQEYPAPYLEVAAGAVYPAWPMGREFQPDFAYYGYRVFPKIKDGIFGAIISHNDAIYGLGPDLTPNDTITKIGKKIARFGQGAYWGYVYADEFYVMRLFRGQWQEIRRKTMPHHDVTGLTIPHFDVLFDIVGYHFVPRQAKTNGEFQLRYFEI